MSPFKNRDGQNSLRAWVKIYSEFCLHEKEQWFEKETKKKQKQTNKQKTTTKAFALNMQSKKANMNN